MRTINNMWLFCYKEANFLTKAMFISVAALDDTTFLELDDILSFGKCINFDDAPTHCQHLLRKWMMRVDDTPAYDDIVDSIEGSLYYNESCDSAEYTNGLVDPVDICDRLRSLKEFKDENINVVDYILVIA